MVLKPQPNAAVGGGADVDGGCAGGVDAGGTLSLGKAQHGMQPSHREFGLIVGGDGGAEQTYV